MMEPRIGDIWKPVAKHSRYDPVEILSGELHGETGCYRVRFVTSGDIGNCFCVVGGYEKFVIMERPCLENE